MKFKRGMVLGIALFLHFSQAAADLTVEQEHLIQQANTELWFSVYEEYGQLARASGILRRCDRPDLLEAINARIGRSFENIANVSFEKLSSISALSSLPQELKQAISRTLAFGLYLNLTTYETGFTEGLRIAPGMNSRFVDVEYISSTYCMAGIASATRLLANNP